MKKKIIILGIIITLIGMICTLMTLNKNYEIEYKDEVKTYIIKKQNKKITVKSKEQVICVKEPCDPITTTNKINFEEKNMKKVNELIEELQKNKKTKIKKEDLTEEQQKIMKSIIKNDETILNEKQENIYIITTNMTYLTMQNDGGSNTNTYYKFNKETNNIKKYQDHYVGFKGYEYKEKLLYEKIIEQELKEELVNLLDNLISNEDIKPEKYYGPYKIENNKNEKLIYNEESIKKLEEILKKIDESTM